MKPISLPNALFAPPRMVTHCAGTPIKAYGYSWVLGAPPDLVDGAAAQTGNAATPTKIALKASAQIASSRVGINATRLPHSPLIDYLPLEAINLIDGDPTTCWCSHTSPTAAADAPWIRIDLTAEAAIDKVVLRKRVPGAPRGVVGSMPLDSGAVEVGMAMPERIEIALSRDGEHWETVVAQEIVDTAEKREFTFAVGGHVAKQVVITASGLARIENWLFGFSIASVEVLNASESNLALASRGVGVTVSSTQHCFGQTVEAHRQLWPMLADLGVKCVRMGYHDDPINWHWVERERGVLEVDYETDASITWLAESGIDIMMALGFGNRLYCQSDPTRYLPQLWEWYYENPAPPTTPDALEAWGRYVRFMARHFRDRVQCFEIWNEWNIPMYFGGPPNIDQYLAIARTAISIIREEAPTAKISLGGIAGFPYGMAGWTDEQLAMRESDRGDDRWIPRQAIQELAADIDIIQWHPFYQPKPSSDSFRHYPADVRAFMTYCRQHGFRGEFVASEWTFGASYPPPTPPNWWGDFVCSEIQKAKYVAQVTVRHTGLGIGSIFCEQWNDNYPLDLSLMRRSVFSDPQSPQQPQAAYYVMRNLATALESLEPGEFPYSLSMGGEFECYGLVRGDERVVAVWLPGLAADTCAGIEADVTVAGAWNVVAVDSMNGTEVLLETQVRDGETTVQGLLVRDYPVLVRFTPRG